MQGGKRNGSYAASRKYRESEPYAASSSVQACFIGGCENTPAAVRVVWRGGRMETREYVCDRHYGQCDPDAGWQLLLAFQ